MSRKPCVLSRWAGPLAVNGTAFHPFTVELMGWYPSVKGTFCTCRLVLLAGVEPALTSQPALRLLHPATSGRQLSVWARQSLCVLRYPGSPLCTSFLLFSH